jgi:hypothetical protein
MEIIKVCHKRQFIFARVMKVGELDKERLSNKFLSHDFDQDMTVLIKCDVSGNLIERGNKKLFSVIEY